MRFKVLKAVKMPMLFSWAEDRGSRTVVLRFSRLELNVEISAFGDERRPTFRQTLQFHIHPEEVLTAIALMLEAVRSSETSVNFYETIRCNISEGCHLQRFPVSTSRSVWL
jgi:hypothetical protein